MKPNQIQYYLDQVVLRLEPTSDADSKIKERNKKTHFI